MANMLFNKYKLKADIFGPDVQKKNSNAQKKITAKKMPDDQLLNSQAGNEISVDGSHSFMHMIFLSACTNKVG